MEPIYQLRIKKTFKLRSGWQVLREKNLNDAFQNLSFAIFQDAVKVMAYKWRGKGKADLYVEINNEIDFLVSQFMRGAYSNRIVRHMLKALITFLVEERMRTIDYPVT